MINTKRKGTGATFSKDKMLRYLLWRVWDESKPLITFIGLNPSIANEVEDDPTIRRITDFSKDWGFGGLYMMNLFPYIATNPKELIHNVGLLKNHLYLWTFTQHCKVVVFAWGTYNKFKDNREEADIVSDMFPYAKCLSKNADGSPKHPLYLPSHTKLVNFHE
jgi:Uncharacterized protein conserved in bacteria